MGSIFISAMLMVCTCNQFVASRLRWPEKGLISGAANGLSRKNQRHSCFCSFRNPGACWCESDIPGGPGGDVTVRVNGESVATSTLSLAVDCPGPSVAVDGDRPKVEFPMHLYYEAMPDNP